MAAPQCTFRIAMLNADTPVPNVLAERGSYGDIFHDLLSAAAARVAPGIKVDSQNFDVVRGQYPESITDFDAALVTGSSASSYDDVEWCHKLDEYVLDVYEKHPQVKIFGSCFGHQIICQSLFRKFGVKVEKDPNGWELGVHEIKLTDDFHKATTGASMSPTPSLHSSNDRLPTPDPASGPGTPKSGLDRIRLQFVHADHVKLPSLDSLPEPWVLLGNTPNCAVQGVYEPGRVLTYQGHFEFDRFVNGETIKVFGAGWKPENLQNALDAVEKDDDAGAAADIVMNFFLERSRPLDGAGGQLTPPMK